jgi:hypothetical protein
LLPQPPTSTPVVVPGSLPWELLSLIPPTVMVSVADSELEALPSLPSVAELEPLVVGSTGPPLESVSLLLPDWLAEALAEAPVLPSPQAPRRAVRRAVGRRSLSNRVRDFMAVRLERG